MRHAPEFLTVMESLAPLLRRHPPLCAMSYGELCDYVALYWNRGTIAFVTDSQGEGQAVCLIRLFRHLEQFLFKSPHEPCGIFCQIELLVANDPVSMASVCEELVDRWGRQSIVLWDRGTRTGEGAPRMFRWHQFQKLVKRVTHGVLENV